MKAARLRSTKDAAQRPLEIADIPKPELKPGHVLLKVRACGVCRTDLHIVEGELEQKRNPLVPGHQIVGVIEDGATRELPRGSRVGVSWMGGVDGTCPFCRRGMENLCDSPTLTGYTVDGGYAEYALVRSDFVYPLPERLDDLHAAPLLCAGIIGFRSVRVAGTERGDKVGLFGFGASAHLILPLLQDWGCEVYVSSRGEGNRKLAEELGAKWIGDEKTAPPVKLDRAITFAPSGKVVLSAISTLRKGGIVAINAIHLDQMPAFDYDKLLWGERQIRSVANMTRDDARNFLAEAARIGIKPKATRFSLDDANEALLEMKSGAMSGAAVLVP